MDSPASYTGSKVLDEHGDRIGAVRDVVYESSALEPTWLVVKPGLLRGEHYVPIEGSYRTEDDNIVVPFTAHDVKTAPKAGDAHVLTSEERERLEDHYHLAR